MKRKKKPSPSKIPRPIVWCRTQRRLSRRTEEQQPSEVDKEGTDHSSPISSPGLSLPPPPPVIQSPNTAGLEDRDSTPSSPLGSQISLEPSSSLNQIAVIQKNPFSIFSPRPRAFESSQSAPVSPTRATSPSSLRRNCSIPLEPLHSPFLGAFNEEAFSFGNLDWDSSEELISPSFTTAPNSPTDPNFLEETETCPTPLQLSQFFQLVFDIESESNSSVQVEADVSMTQAMKEADNSLKTSVQVIQRKVKSLNVDELVERGPAGVREKLDEIESKLDKFNGDVDNYSLKVEDVADGDIPVKNGVNHDAAYWNQQLESLISNVEDHRKQILKKLREMELAEKAPAAAAEKRKEDAEIAKEREAAAEKERLTVARKAKAEVKATTVRSGMTKLRSILPSVRNWSQASRDEVIQAFKLLPTIQTEFEKVCTNFSDLSLLCHEADVSEDDINHTMIFRELEKLRKDVEVLTEKVTHEDRERELHSASGGYKANVPLPRFGGYRGEDWFVFEKNLLDAFSRNNVAGPDKFDQLRTCLSGDALRHVPVSVEKDFKKALLTLKKIYGNPLTVMEAKTADIKKLGVIPETILVNGKNNYSNVVKYCLEMEALVKALLDLAKNHKELQMDIYSTQTRKLIINQFQLEEIRQIKKKIKSLTGCDALEAVLEFVEEYREECQDLLDVPSSTTSQNHKHSKPQHGANFLQFEKNHLERKRKDDCIICHHLEVKRKDLGKDLYENHSSHNPIGCPKFRQLTNSCRKTIIKETNLCYHCLYPRVPDRYGNPHDCLNRYSRRSNSLCKGHNCDLHMWICPDHVKENKQQVKSFIERYKLDLNFRANHYQLNSAKKKDDKEENKIAKIKDDLLKEGKTPVDIPGGPVLFLLGLLKGNTRPLLTFFDSGASDAIAREGVPGKEVRGTVLHRGPFEMTVASNLKVSAGDEWVISLERTDNQHQLFRCITLKEICGRMEMIKCGKILNNLKGKLQNFRVPKTVGGEVDLLLGCRYNNVYPEAVHQFENGLTIYKLKLASHNKSINSCLGGPHEAFEAHLSSTNIQLTLQKTYLILDAYKRQGPPSIADMVSFSPTKLPFSQDEKVSVSNPDVMEGHGDEDSSVDLGLVAPVEQGGRGSVLATPVCPAPLRGSEQVAIAEVGTDVEQNGDDKYDDAASQFFRDEFCLDELNILSQQQLSCRCFQCLHTIITDKEKLRDAKAWFRNMESGLENVYRCPTCRDCLRCKNSDQTEVVSLREEQEQQMIEDSVQLDFPNKRIIVHLPKRGEEEQFLSSNRDIAQRVLISNWKKAEKNPQLKEDADKAFSKLFKNNHAILVRDLPPEVQAAFINKPVQHYLPWRFVYKVDSLSSPVRSVYDASTNTRRRPDGTGGRCLNDLLCKGVINTLDLLRMVLRFSISKRAVSGDIEQFYCQCRLVPEDFNLLRFLHSPGLDSSQAPEEAVFQCLIFGLKSCTAQTEFAKQKLADAVKKTYPVAAELLTRGAFVDDLADSKKSDADIQKLISDTDIVLGKVGMKVKEWNYSGRKPSEISSSDGVSISVGGFGWVPELDSVYVKVPRLHFGTRRRGRLDDDTKFFVPTEGASRQQHLEEMDKFVPETLTRRLCASKAASIFDISGLLSPIMAPIKILMRETVRETAGESWDTPISTSLRNKWLDAFLKIEECRGLGYQRAIMPEDAVSEDLRLICLGDAADEIAMVGVWGGFLLANGKYSCKLIMGRSFLPSNSTIPRKELEAQMAVANLGMFVEKSLSGWPITRIQGSDSTIALSWINSEKLRLSIFHRNRVIAVRRSIKLDNVFHVKTENMAADVGTRPDKVKVEDVAPGSKWINGANWMKLSVEEAVKNEDIKPISDLKISKEEENEYKEGIIFEKMPEVLTRGHAINIRRVSEIEKRVKFSGYLISPLNIHLKKYVNIMTYVFKFVFNCKRAVRARREKNEELSVADKDIDFNGDYLKDPLEKIPNINLSSHVTRDDSLRTVESLEWETMIERSVWTYLFRLTTAEVRQFVPKTWIEKHTVESGGVLFSKSRILEGMEFKKTSGLEDVSLDPLQINTKTPVLDRYSPMSYMIGIHIHWNISKHRGIENTHRMMLERVCVYHCYSLMKEISQECIQCKKFRKKYLEVETGPVGEHSLTIAPPMFACQADMFGPINVYCPGYSKDTRGRPARQSKVYGMVFVCPVSRLISCQVIEKKDTSGVIDGLTRLACEYGFPRYLMVDQDTAIMKALRDAEVELRDLQHKLFKEEGVIFSVCPVAGHNYSGQCERAIRTIQELMERHNVGVKKLHATGLQTLLDLVTNEINSLPLGYSYGRDENNSTSLKIITPNFFKFGRNNSRVLTGPVRLPVNGGELTNNVNELFQAMFQTWSETLVPKMMYRPTKFGDTTEGETLSEGDLVMFKKTDDNLGTAKWTIGMIEQITVSRDGKIRRALVKYQNPEEYKVTETEIRITQRMTDRAVRSLIKIYDIDQYVIEEDLAHLSRKLLISGDSTTDTGAGDSSGSSHHSVLFNTDTLQVYLAKQNYYVKLIPSYVSGQSVEVTPQPDEESDDDAGQDVRDGVGGCPHCWPETDVSTILGSRCYQCRPIRVRFVEEEYDDMETANIITGVINLIKNCQVIMDDGHVRP